MFAFAWIDQHNLSIHDALVADRFLTDQASFGGAWVMRVVVATCLTVVFRYFLFSTFRAFAILIWGPVRWAAQTLLDSATWEE